MTNAKQTPLNKAQKLANKLGRKTPAMEHDSKTDSALIVAYLNGDEDSGWELFESYRDIASIVYRFPSKPPFKTAAMSRLFYAPLSGEDKEDLFQEIALHFFQLVKEYDPSMKKPFEYMIRSKLHQRVFNQFFSEFIEIQTNEVEFEDTFEFEEKARDVVLDKKRVPAEHIELYQAFNQLSGKQREVIELSVIKGWNSTEIAKELDMKPNTVRKQLSRGMEKLKSLMIKNEEETV